MQTVASAVAQRKFNQRTFVSFSTGFETRSPAVNATTSRHSRQTAKCVKTCFRSPLGSRASANAVNKSAVGCASPSLCCFASRAAKNFRKSSMPSE